LGTREIAEIDDIDKMGAFNRPVGPIKEDQMATGELEMFLNTWEREAESTLKLLRALPSTKYDFKPDPGGRSLGELAWHLPEGEAYMSFGIENGRFGMDVKPPNVERPRTVEALAPGFERIHKEAVARIRKLKAEDLDRSIPFFSGPLPIRDILWSMIIFHAIHHRGQLSLMCRLAGGQAPGLYGPNREETAAMRASATTH
jgi:uncharacterized damage-inducible protein DinB